MFRRDGTKIQILGIKYTDIWKNVIEFSSIYVGSKLQKKYLILNEVRIFMIIILLYFYKYEIILKQIRIIDVEKVNYHGTLKIQYKSQGQESQYRYVDVLWFSQKNILRTRYISKLSLVHALTFQLYLNRKISTSSWCWVIVIFIIKPSRLWKDYIWIWGSWQEGLIWVILSRSCLLNNKFNTFQDELFAFVFVRMEYESCN